jgi:hypothetical protein
MPSQWQGSEDLLLVRQPETDEEHQDDEGPLDLDEEAHPGVDEDAESTGAVEGPDSGPDP